MNNLQDILYKVHIKQVIGTTQLNVKDVQIDSRCVTNGSIFIAIKGDKTDGHHFIEQVIQNGAIAVICQTIPERIDPSITYVLVENTHEALAVLATNFYNNPSKKINLIGVTGTNGKTTIATLLFKLFTQLGYKCGLISTVQNQIENKISPSTHTTPDAIKLNELLKQMVEENCTHVFMEVSSHAIHQHRITGLEFKGGIFSNITHDHLDYHKTFDEYIKVKKKFFDDLPSNAFAISNADDKRGAVMLQNTKASKHFYSLKSIEEFKGKILDNALTGLQMLVNDKEVHFRLIGEFNAYNLLAVYATAICLNENKEKVLTALSMLTGAEGRFDYIIGNQLIIGIVDYAHTPDALENVLTTINKLRKGHEQIITVVGCGGDRDKTKRPLMAQTACDLSDKVILTSDNPRTESPEQILKDMEVGLNTAAKRKYITITDRREAIATAVNMAKGEDIILVAGKGHEKYQEINQIKYPFDDKEILNNLLNKQQ
ncbi:MAG TPA: UDP-N-acetylmuramoyl-L-alanyl-D-glutamate--2,6-diaminopimelate ligase [Chitinophagaceae bacterium]|nr:UDP-N-acetylmuramoyl-L-alanyl-D-glutamate--2,6-diaminopimelate ligase [Chitinophagaceae bacterium]HNL82466.1 UDP-N-acetylmuramoyl-L-alanyl-D-glutamate--2,6-diaminopimelate ligase [Chitinophagaceae bacterium]